jgi:hypothetical protein
MIYQITYDLYASHSAFFKIIESIGDFVFLNKAIFVNTSLHKSEVMSKLKNVILDDEQFFIKYVDIDSSEFPHQIENWVGKIRFELQKTEAENLKKEQETNLLNFLDALEKELDKQIVEGSG